MDETYTQNHFTFLDEGVKIKATLRSNKLLYISGLIEGKAETSDKIIITSTGKVKGNLKAPSIEVYGTITGDLQASEHIIIRSTATVKGNIFGNSISIEDGATLDGYVRSGVSTETETSAKKNEKPDQPKKMPKELEYKPAPNRFVADVLIHLQAENNDEKFIESIQKGGIEFMNALKFSLEIFDEPTLNPFFQKLTFVRKGYETKDEVAEDFIKGKKILEEAFIKKQNTSNKSKLLKTSEKLASVIDQAETLALVLGRIVIVKHSEENVQSLAVELLNDDMIATLKKDERLINQPKELYEQLTK